MADGGYSPLLVGAFEAVFHPWMRRRIADVLLAKPPSALPGDRPVLFVANHVSWWDGFLLRRLQREVRPRAHLHTVMSGAELRRHGMLRRMGGVGLDPATPSSVRRALRTLERRVAARSDAVIAYFPQGEIRPSFQRPLGFRRGVELFARRLDALVVPVGLHMEPLRRSAPTFFVVAGAPLGPEATAAELEARVADELDGIHAFLAVHGERAAEHWTGELPRGGEAARPAVP